MSDWRLDPDDFAHDDEAAHMSQQADHEQQATHDPILHRVTVAHLSPVVRWRLACPCGRVPVALLTRDEVNDELRKHPVDEAGAA